MSTDPMTTQPCQCAGERDPRDCERPDCDLNQQRRLAVSLAASQEPLGRDFERVLYNNLWGLYVRS